MSDDRSSSTIVVPTSPAELLAAGFLARYPKVTRDSYRIHLRHWFEWCSGHGVAPLEAQRSHIEVWARHLSEQLGRKPRTVAAKLNAVCGFYKFAFLDGYIDANPAVYVRRPKIDFVSTTLAPSRSELADILVAAETESVPTHALICLLGLSGLRIGECLALDIENLGHDRGYRTIHLPNRKGGKVATLSVSQRTAWAIERAIAGRVSGPVLLGPQSQRMSTGTVRRTIRRLCRKCGVTKSLSAHSFRHAYVSLALDAGVPERDIIDSTSHSDTRMLRFYDRHRGAIERNATHAVTAFVSAA